VTDAIYSAPVRRNGPAFAVVGGLALAVGAGFGLIDRNNSFGGALLTATLLTLGALVFGVLVIFALLLPNRIEVEGDEIRLVARRSVSKYVPAEMVVRRQPTGDFAFFRKKTGRRLALFQDEEPARVAEVFGAAGAEVQFGHDDL
jgi:hypothetical protein